MTKIDVFSGFLGAGKTTLIKKLIREAYRGEKLVLIENEFGEIGIDGGFMKEAGITVNEMNSGCICCSLSGDFSAALGKVMEEFAPDRIMIEPSGVGKLSDVVRAVENVSGAETMLNSLTTVVDASKARVYLKNFGEFFQNQIENAGCIVLSRTGSISPEKLSACLELLRGLNRDAVIVTTPWDELDGKQIQAAMEKKDTLAAAMETLRAVLAQPDDDDDDDEDDEDGHEHHHHHDHEHHHHDDDDDDDDDDEHEHHHEHEHHEHDHGHEHHHHHHHHHGEHDADEIFQSWGVETARVFTAEELKALLDKLTDAETYGDVLRAKGIVAAPEGQWIHFDFVPGETDVRFGTPEVTGRLCVIGAGLKEEAVAALFGV